MKKKMKFYLPILLILWSGTFAQGIAREAEDFVNRKDITAIHETISQRDSLQKESTSILFEKEYKGKISQTEMEQEASSLLASYQGEMVKEMIGNNFYSFYGFSDKVKEYIISDGEKINLNLVITYDEEEDITHIIWASPFYNKDF